MKKLLYLFLFLVSLALINNSQAAICCANGCFSNANCCGADGNGYVGCTDAFNQTYCPSQTVFAPEACLTCQCTDPETCSWAADDNLCSAGEVCDYFSLENPNATQCIAGNCPICENCGQGFLNVCDIAECHACDAGECYFESNLGVPSCSNCANANNCNDFDDDKNACNGQITVCNQFSCYWEDPSTDCRQCPNPSAAKCSDYEDEETCNINPCGASQCWWTTQCEDAPTLKEIQPNPAVTVIGNTVQYTAIAEFTDLSTIDVTLNTTFFSDNPVIASMSANIATGVSEGSAIITGNFLGTQKTASLQVGDPNSAPEFCEAVLPDIQGNCTQTGDIGCWDPNAALGEQCCGESQSDNYVNTINHGCTFSSNFGKVVYQTDPDESSEFCGLMSVKMNGIDTQGCNQESETYCWASSGFVLNNGNCCGDDLNEAWNYSTNLLLDNIIVDGTCQNSQWYLRDNNDLTYYNLWTQDLIQ